MGITVSSPQGVTIEFPDGTDEATISRVMRESHGPQQQKGTPTIEALGRGALQGATFGLSDEIYAGAKGAASAVTGGSFGPTYDKELADVRDANKRAKDTNPWAYMGGEVAGGFAVPMGMIGGAAKAGKVAVEASRLGRTGRGMAVGAGTGAAYGFGEGEGGDGTLMQQAGNRMLNALPSALGGAVVGAAAPTLVDVGAAIVKGATNPIRAAMRPQQTAQTKVAESFLRDAPEGAAIDNVMEHASQRFARVQATKPDAMLADVGGQNSRDLLRSAANMPSQNASRLQRELDRRQGFQWSRIEKDLKDTLADGDQFASTVGVVSQRLKDVGHAEFQKAFAQPWNVRDGDQLMQVVDRPWMAKLTQRMMERTEGMTGQKVDAGNQWEFLHRLKMEIDTNIGTLKRGQGNPSDNWTLRDLTILKRELVDAIAAKNPRYKVALQRYGDEAGLKNALESGAEEFRNLRWRDLQETMSGMTPPERSMYRMGAARSMFEDIERGNITRDRTESLFSSPDIQNKLGVLFPDNASRRDFQRRLVIEARMADTRKAVQGNSTTAKQLAQGQEAGQPVAALNAVANATAGRFEPAMAYLGRQMQAFSGMTPGVANEIIRSMMQKGALGTQEELQQAIVRASREPEFRAQLVKRILAGAAAARSSEGEQRQQQPAYQ